MDPRPRLAIVGAGRCASSIAVALLSQGWPVAGLTCRRRDSAQAASEILGGAPILASNAEALAAADVILIGVPDRDIEAVAAGMAGPDVDLTGKCFLHLAGVHDASVLHALATRGAATGSLHPLQTFPERVEAPAWLRGIRFAVEGAPAAVAVAVDIVRLCQGHTLKIAPGSKARYHAAATVASNHLAAVLDFSYTLLRQAGVDDPAEARRALMPLVLTTIANVEAQSAERALTGPIVRGDEETVVRHLLALAPEQRSTYAGLARVTLDLARRSGRLKEPQAGAIAGRLEPPSGEIVLSLRATTLAGLRERAATRPPGTRVEFRLDWLEESVPSDLSCLDPADILAVRPGTAATPELARAWLARHARDQNRRVDLALGAEADFPRDRMVLSWHGPADQAVAAARRIALLRPAVGKVVVEAVGAADLALIPEIARILRLGSPVVAAFASGEFGIPTRVLPAQFGSDWTYACHSESERTGDAQLEARLLAGRYRIAESAWQPSPVWGLVGWPIGHSLSPRVFNGRLAGPYAPFPSRELQPILALCSALDIRGLSVTMPLKEQAYRMVDAHSPTATASRSVNTIVRDGQRLIGHDTDAMAVAAAAAELLPLKGTRALILGAGGSARSAAIGLRDRGANVTLVARNPQKARTAAELLGVASAGQASEVDWELLVNATPVGMGADFTATPMAADQLTGRAVLDLIYDPRETRLITEARARGLAVAPGLEVFLRQALLQLELFGGTAASLEELRTWIGP